MRRMVFCNEQVDVVPSKNQALCCKFGSCRTKIKRGEHIYTTEIKLSALKGTRACATTLADSRCNGLCEYSRSSLSWSGDGGDYH